ncbi:uncharacterized protein LOC128210005 isoform X2 [Mya arenaria]|nr:uncharacterized protein LOC128210005 isoform X2 [Mya arenaria]
MAKSDPKRAIDILLDILGNSPERGVWTKFLQALKKAGFVTLANIIVGYEVVDTSHHTEFLRQMAPTVREFIKPLELLPNLMNDQVINSDDKENIEQRQRNEGDISATDLLLERITCKSQFGYRSLRNALSATKQTDVAKMLDMKSIDLQENSLSIDHLRPPPPPPRTQIPPVKLETDPVDDETFSFTPAKTEKETKSDSEWDDYSTVDFLPPKRTPLGIPIPPIEKETDPDGVDHLRPPPPPPRTQIPTSQLETDPDDVDQLRPPPLPPRIPIPPSKLETDTYDVDQLRPPPLPPRIPIPPSKLETDTYDDLSTSDVPELPPRCPLICTIKRKRSCRHIKAISTYTAENPQELSHAIGDVFEIKELYPTWFWAKSIDSSSAGIVFRVNVVYLQAPSPKNPENRVGEAPIYYKEFDDEDISPESNTVVEVCNETRVPIRKNYENIALDCEKKTWYTAINSLFPWNLG